MSLLIASLIQVRKIANNRFSLRFQGPSAHRGGGFMPRSYPRIGTPDIDANNVTCTSIRCGDLLMASAQMRMELFEDHHGSYTVATPAGQLYTGTFPNMIRNKEVIQIGDMKVYFDSKDCATRAFRHLKHL